MQFASVAFFVSLGLLLAPAVSAAPADRERAKKIHDRLVGTPPDAATLNLMETDVMNGDLMGAAARAMTHPDFYRVSLKNWVTPWTNVDSTPIAPLNDYTATVIGMIRDDVPFNNILTADLVYVGQNVAGLPAYSHTDNQHYEDLESRAIDLSDPTLFTGVTQSGLQGAQLFDTETAGVTTTRAAGEAYFSMGTNRRMWRYTAINYLCRDMEDLRDNTRPTDRIRQDVSRSPGGDSLLYHNECSACHTGQDPLAGAYAFYDFDMAQGRVVYTRGMVQPKMVLNANTSPFGYVTVDDRWDNFWREGPNQVLDWRAPGGGGGYGLKSMGAEVAGTYAFSVCQVEKAFEHVCFRPPNDMTDLAQVDLVATEFEADNYNMKNALAKLAVFCSAP
jgi:hypothetical protein